MEQAIRRLGAFVNRGLMGLGQIAIFGVVVLRSLFLPPLRGRSVVAAVYDSGVLSLALICASGLTVGFVLGLQLYYTLSRFGAESSLGTAVGLALIRELGPVLTGLLVTGRAGSATCAEIGSMKATDQLDGLRMMAIDPIHFVVMPRALAIVFVMRARNNTALVIVFVMRTRVNTAFVIVCSDILTLAF